MSGSDFTFTGESKRRANDHGGTQPGQSGAFNEPPSFKYEPGSLPPGYQSYLGTLGRHQTVYNAHTARLIYDGKKSRKAIQRTTVDYNTSVLQFLRRKAWRPHGFRSLEERHRMFPEPDFNFVVNMEPSFSTTGNPTVSVTARYVHTSINKLKCPVNSVRWTRDGRRLITGSTSGEFTLWNGFMFNFETIMQAHDSAVRSMIWSHNGSHLISADHGGVVKYWQTSLNNVKAFQAHKESVRDLTFAPSDNKFASCSDDGAIKVWNFSEAREESSLTGHGWDVKCIDWHPQRALIASGSKDNLVKLWDPKSGKSIATLHGHKNTILSVSWNANGNWLATASRDQLLRVYDIRIMKELQSFKKHTREVNSVAWHPHEETMFCSGASDGSIIFWAVGEPECLSVLEKAHEQNIWALDWHPLGHILCSGSNDHSTRFWTRNRPADDKPDSVTSSHDPSVNPLLTVPHFIQQAVEQGNAPAHALLPASLTPGGFALPKNQTNPNLAKASEQNSRPVTSRILTDLGLSSDSKLSLPGICTN